jgi:hypothetical protein
VSSHEGRSALIKEHKEEDVEERTQMCADRYLTALQFSALPKLITAEVQQQLSAAGIGVDKEHTILSWGSGNDYSLFSRLLHGGSASPCLYR